MPMQAQALAVLLSEIVEHHRDAMITFAVLTETGQETYQTPIIKPISLEKTKDGHHILMGYNLRRIPDDPSEEISSKAIVRSYRLDRVIPHTLQFLNPAISPVGEAVLAKTLQKEEERSEALEDTPPEDDI